MANVRLVGMVQKEYSDFEQPTVKKAIVMLHGTNQAAVNAITTGSGVDGLDDNITIAWGSTATTDDFKLGVFRKDNTWGWKS